MTDLISVDDICDLIKNSHRRPEAQGKYAYPWILGKNYFIRTVTMHLTGRLTFVGPQELVLEDAAWIADSGRFNEAIKNPDNCSEVEPFVRPVIVGRGAIVDATEITHVVTKVK